MVVLAIHIRKVSELSLIFKCKEAVILRHHEYLGFHASKKVILELKDPLRRQLSASFLKNQLLHLILLISYTLFRYLSHYSPSASIL